MMKRLFIAFVAIPYAVAFTSIAAAQETVEPVVGTATESAPTAPAPGSATGEAAPMGSAPAAGQPAENDLTAESETTPGTGVEEKAAGGEHAASADAHGAHDGIPSVVWYQAINFLIYIGLLFYFLRKPVKNYFASRQAAFNAALVKAQAAKAEAEAQKKEIQDRLNRLQAESDKAIAQAKAEAEQMRARIVKDAEELANNLRAEAQRSASFEIQRAKNELREELLSQSLALSQKILQEKVGEADQKRLQTEFVEKIEVR